jgi:hypothetical protein
MSGLSEVWFNEVQINEVFLYKCHRHEKLRYHNNILQDKPR